MRAVSQILGGQVIAIDGKVVRQSQDGGIGKAATDMVGAWATANHLVLGQIKVDEKSKEVLYERSQSRKSIIRSPSMPIIRSCGR